jgi:TPR repeat protein
MNKWLVLAAVVIFGAAAGLLFLPARVTFNVAAPNTPTVDLASVQSKADAGDAAAQMKLGLLYARGEGGLTNSYVEAARWYRKAADQGNSAAQFGLGELYEAGQGVPHDPGKALELYRQAADQGLPAAQYTLGFLYEAGRGVKADPVEASKWFLKAAEGGDKLAQYDIGQRYELGIGVAADRVEALKWFTLAANQGQSDSAARADRARGEMSREQVGEAQRRVQAFSPRQVQSLPR